MNRQDFLNRIGRSFLFMVIAGGSGMLVYKGKVGKSKECPESFVCNNCKLMKNCSLPEAKKFRKNGKG